MRVYLFLFLLIGYIGGINAWEKDSNLPIIPYPKEIKIYNNKFTIDVSQFGISANIETESLINVIYNDLYLLTGTSPKENTSKVLSLHIDKKLQKEEYELIVDNYKICIRGGSYSAVSMGWTTLLQSSIINNTSLTFREIAIKDKPDLNYRGVMLDLARQFHHPQNVKNLIDLCRWNKINFIQMHLNDNERNVFPTKIFPKTLKEGEFYTEDELKDIIKYAEVRGITLIPEIEGPGHSTILREAYPEIFGEKELRAINLGSDLAIEGMKKLTKEAIDMFPNSPYFHIGADEVKLDKLRTHPDVLAKLKEKGYNDVHDLYLDYIVEMYEFVKSEGKIPIVWEGFKNSANVTIPADIIVCPFETYYQRPDSLAAQGYRMINTSWKPIYIVPERRWPIEKIYHWNHYTWENWWDVAPATKTPIIINEKERNLIIGSQICSWEMSEEMEFPALSKRMSAFSEVCWNSEERSNFLLFKERLNKNVSIINRILYPFIIEGSGFTDRDYDGVYYNWENHFAGSLTISLKSTIPNTIFRYTLDRSFPTIKSSIFPEKITFTNDTFLKVAQYSEDGSLISYYPVLYEHKPIKVEFVGKGNNDNNQAHEVNFTDSIKVKLSTPLCEGTIRYTLDGTSVNSNNGHIYKGEIISYDSFELHIQYFDKNNKIQGAPYYFKIAKNEK